MCCQSSRIEAWQASCKAEPYRGTVTTDKCPDQIALLVKDEGGRGSFTRDVGYRFCSTVQKAIEGSYVCEFMSKLPALSCYDTF